MGWEPLNIADDEEHVKAKDSLEPETMNQGAQQPVEEKQAPEKISSDCDLVNKNNSFVLFM